MPDRRSSEPTRAVTGVSIVLLVAGLAGCAPTGSATATPATAGSATAASTTGAPSLATSPTPVASPSGSTAPRPSGTLAWPATFDVELVPGTYFSSPPFGVPFTIEVAEPGWFSGHLHAEFFDLLRFDGVGHDSLPNRMLAFGVPQHFRGRDGDVAASTLVPATAVDLLEGAWYLHARNRHAVTLFGLEGVVVDIHADVRNTPLFGGEEGNFGLSPERDARLAVLAHQDGFLLVLVLAEADDLDGAWAQAQGVLSTVRLGDGAQRP